MIRTTIGISTFLLLLVLSINVSGQETIDYLVNWEPNPEPDITGYVLYRSLDRETGFEAVDSVGNNVFNYIDEGLEKGTRYYYRLIAKNTSEERSAFSNPASGMAIPTDAAQSLQDSCKITTRSQSGEGIYTINWETSVLTTGYIQYDSDAILDSMSNWDDTDYATNHTVELQNLEAERTYYARAVAYDEYNNLTISIPDSFLVEEEQPAPPSAPLTPAIYPVPYHPVQGDMTMNGLPGSTIRIFNSNGMEIYSSDVPPAGKIEWDGKNLNGSRVMSGIYYVVMTNTQGKEIKKPIMVVN